MRATTSCATTAGAATAPAATAAPAARASASGRTRRPAKVHGPSAQPAARVRTHGRARRLPCGVYARRRTRVPVLVRRPVCTHALSDACMLGVSTHAPGTHTACVSHAHTDMHTHTLTLCVCYGHTGIHRPLHRLHVVCTHRHILKGACILIHTHSHTQAHITLGLTVIRTHGCVYSHIHIPTFTHPLILTLYPLVLTVAHLRMHSDIHACVRTTRYSVTCIGTDSEHTYTPIFTLVDMPTQSCTLRGTLKEMCVPTFSRFHT